MEAAGRRAAGRARTRLRGMLARTAFACMTGSATASTCSSRCWTGRPVFSSAWWVPATLFTIYNRQTLQVKEVARSCSCPFRRTIMKLEDEKEVCYELRFGHRGVYLPDRPEILYLFVIHGFGS